MSLLQLFTIPRGMYVICQKYEICCVVFILPSVAGPYRLGFFFLFNRYVCDPSLYSRQLELQVGNFPTRSGHKPERIYRKGGHEKLL